MRVLENICIGSLLLKNRAILSPMESVSDVGFRKLCHNLGASLTWTEMVRADALCRNNQATLDLIDTYDTSTPTGLQLLVKNVDVLKKTLSKIEALSLTDQYRHFSNICAIDLNFGCPSPDVISEGAGPALLKRQKRLKEIFIALSEWKIATTLPNIGAVGCKIRLGLNEYEQNKKVYLPVIEAANEAGLDYMVVHARHAKQRSRDLPTWSAISEIKQVANMPIIGNGNVNNVEDANRMMKETGCDGVMIARASIRNPWIFNGFRTDAVLQDSSNNGLFVGHSDYPSVSEVEEARHIYNQYAEEYKTKPKFKEFHKNNFDRINMFITKAALSRQEAKSFTSKDDSKSKTESKLYPKNSHMS